MSEGGVDDKFPLMSIPVPAVVESVQSLASNFMQNEEDFKLLNKKDSQNSIFYYYRPLQMGILPLQNKIVLALIDPKEPKNKKILIKEEISKAEEVCKIPVESKCKEELCRGYTRIVKDRHSS